MTSKQIVWIKVPSDMDSASLAEMADMLSNAFKGSQYGFFIVPDRFDILSKEEIIEFLEQTLRSLRET